MQKEYIDLLLAKLADDNQLLTLEELRFLRSVFNSFEGRLYIEEKVVSVINETTDEPYDYDFDRLYAKIEKNIKTQAKPRRPLRRIVAAAAAVLLPLMVAGGIWLYVARNGDGSPQPVLGRVVDEVRLTLADGSEIILDRNAANARIAERGNIAMLREEGSLVVEKLADVPAPETDAGWVNLNVPKGTVFDVVLEDGTHVWLNADSRLRFPSAFPGGERRVFVKGEAYFEVAHDPKKPFIVEGGGQQLRVLGTSFNISAYRNDDATFTTLVEGSVELKAQGGGSGIVLRPGQQARLDAGAAGFTTAEVDTRELISWKEGMFVFEGNTLEQVMRQLARWYDMEYTFEDDGARGYILRGMMPVQSRVTDIFDILEASGQVRFTVENNSVKIKARK